MISSYQDYPNVLSVRIALSVVVVHVVHEGMYFLPEERQLSAKRDQHSDGDIRLRAIYLAEECIEVRVSTKASDLA